MTALPGRGGIRERERVSRPVRLSWCCGPGVGATGWCKRCFRLIPGFRSAPFSEGKLVGRHRVGVDQRENSRGHRNWRRGAWSSRLIRCCGIVFRAPSAFFPVLCVSDFLVVPTRSRNGVSGSRDCRYRSTASVPLRAKRFSRNRIRASCVIERVHSGVPEFRRKSARGRGESGSGRAEHRLAAFVGIEFGGLRRTRWEAAFGPRMARSELANSAPARRAGVPHWSAAVREDFLLGKAGG